MLLFFLRLFIRCRYSIEVRGLNEILTKLDRGTLFLSNLTTEIDPLLIYLILEKKNVSITPILVKKWFSVKWLKKIWKILNVKFIAPYDKHPSSLLKKKLKEQTLEINKEIDKGKSFLFFPKGKLKISSYDQTKYTIISDFLDHKPKIPIVLVTIDGMFGSSFSHKILGINTSIVKTIGQCLKVLLKNGLFFMPKRSIVIDFSFPNEEFPWNQNDHIVMSYLEIYFNRKLDQSLDVNEHGQYIISHYFWKKREEIEHLLPTLKEEDKNTSESIEKRVKQEIARLVNISESEIDDQNDLFEDLGLNSLDVTELVVFLEEYFNQLVGFESLKTVEDVILAASGKENRQRYNRESCKRDFTWKQTEGRKETFFFQAKSIIESFLKTCDRMDGTYACADRMDIMSYHRMKSFVIGLAEEFKQLQGEKIGIMLPPCAFMNIAVLALMLVKKVPVMINWTLGAHHLEEVMSQTKIETILSEEWLLDKLGYDLPKSIEEKIYLIESLRDELSFEKRKEALDLSRMNTDELMSYYHLKHIKPDDVAAILFTSGTDKKPKGVPLTHRNLLSNQQAAYEAIDLNKNDIMMGILPSFHAFGFSVTNILPLMIGCRVVYLMNTLDLRRAGELIYERKVTVLCATPTFLRILLSIIPLEKLKSLRLIVLGAERLPKEIEKKANELLPDASIVEGYGATECSPIISLNRLHKLNQGVGYPLRNVDVKVIDVDDHHELERNQQGLIIVRGPNVFNGYLNDDEDPFIYHDKKKWYNTKDLGIIDDSGAIYLKGRISRTVKKAGELISLIAIEEALLSSIMKEDEYKSLKTPLHLAVIGKENEKHQTDLILFINYPVALEKVNQYLQQAGFTNLFRLKKVITLEELPLFATGKINYRKLEDY